MTSLSPLFGEALLSAHLDFVQNAIRSFAMHDTQEFLHEMHYNMQVTLKQPQQAVVVLPTNHH